MGDALTLLAEIGMRAACVVASEPWAYHLSNSPGGGGHRPSPIQIKAAKMLDPVWLIYISPELYIQLYGERTPLFRSWKIQMDSVLAWVGKREEEARRSVEFCVMLYEGSSEWSRVPGNFHAQDIPRLGETLILAGEVYEVSAVLRTFDPSADAHDISNIKTSVAVYVMLGVHPEEKRS